jgi:hypothetical protein
MRILFIILFTIFFCPQDSTKVKKNLKMQKDTLIVNSSIQKMNDLSTKLDSIIIKLQKRKNDTLNLQL